MLNFGNKEFRNLQEQVLENAKNIEILKERPTLKPVVVAELPAVGEENILYLVPKNPDPDTSDADSYDEYIWLPEKQTYEFVGSTALNISNMVTTDTNQTITGEKSFNAIANFNNGLKANAVEIDGETTMKADASSVTNVWKFRPVNDFNLYVSRDGSDRFLFQANMFAPATYQTTSINLGSANYKWDNVWCNKVNLGTDTTNLYIAKDDSDRIGIYHNNIERIKIGTDKSTYCAANWLPDEDNKYLLGNGTLRWKSISINSVINGNGNLLLRGNPNINVALGNNTEDGAITPSSNNKFTIGTTSKVWKAVYTTSIGDATKSVNVADIVTNPHFDSPTAYASGTLDANGQCTIDIATLGVPTPGLYEFHYGGCQCYVTFTTSNIQNAATTPIIVSCPVLNGSATQAGWLKITRNADILTFTVASPESPAQPSGMPWSIYKVM